MLESKFAESIPFAALSPNNFGTFSLKYAYILKSICAEIVFFIKEYGSFDFKDEDAPIDLLDRYISLFHELKEKAVRVKDITIKPFADCEKANDWQNNIWWKCFDDVTRNGLQDIEIANQENTVFLLAALYIIETAWLEKAQEQTEEIITDHFSELFVFEE